MIAGTVPVGIVVAIRWPRPGSARLAAVAGVIALLVLAPLVTPD